MSTSIIEGNERASVTDLLPSCQRCRRLRRRCDTELPSCRRCTKARETCTYYDDILGRTIERSYIQHLLLRIEEADVVGESTQTHTNQDTHTLAERPNNVVDSVSSREIQISRTALLSNVKPSTTRLEDAIDCICKASPNQHELSAPEGTAFRFFGPTSLVILLVRVLAYTQSTAYRVALDKPPHPLRVTVQDQRPSTLLWTQWAVFPPSRTFLPDIVTDLLSVYDASFNTIYHIASISTIQTDYEACRSLLQREDLDMGTLTGRQSYQYHHVNMMCALACFSGSRQNQSLLGMCTYFYREATKCMINVTSELSWDSLRAMVLLSLFFLVCPEKGDMWRSVDYASRLSIDLAYTSHHTNCDFSLQTYAVSKEIFWIVYALEQTITQMFGRPTGSLTDSAILDEMLSSSIDHPPGHVYDEPTNSYRKLIRLRASIYSMLVHPDATTLPASDWYVTQYYELRAHSPILDPDVGISSLSDVHCTLTFHSAVLMLFQPLVLQFLSEVGTNETGMEIRDHKHFSLPRESYQSAIRLLDIYEKIFEASPPSALANYPLTCVSGNEIAVAGITVLCFGLALLNERTVIHSIVDEDVTEDYRDLQRASGSCLHMLSLCSQYWHGLAGAVEIHKSLSSTVLPAVARKF